MRYTFYFLIALGLTAVGFGLSGCGSGSSRLSDNQSTLTPFVPSGTNNNGSSNNNNNNGNSNGNLLPPERFPVAGVGYHEVNYTTHVNRVLKIRWTPDTAGGNIVGTGFPAEYSKLLVFFKVGDVERNSGLLSNGLIDPTTGSSPGTQSTAVIDYASGFTPNCPANSVGSCSQEVTIKVYRPNSNYQCYTLHNCPPVFNEWFIVQENYPWRGVLEVQTDYTNPL